MALGKGKGEGESGAQMGNVLGSDKVEAFLGQGSKVVGKLTFNGPVELGGYIEGEINSQKQLTIGETAVINAKIVGSEVLVRGTVNGDIVASKRLCLKTPAKVIGNITSKNLSIEEGVVFEGNCTMEGAPAGKSDKDSGPKKIEATG